MDNYIELGKRYKRLNTLCLLIIAFAIIALLSLSIKLWLKIVFVLVILFAGFRIIAFVNSIVSKILYKECNPEKYYCVSKVIYNTITFDAMLAVFALGDFNRAAEYFKLEINKYKKTNISKLNTHFKYAESLFFAGDYENCIKVSVDFQNQMSFEKYKKAYASHCNLCTFFESFINKDYDACLSALDTLKIDTIKYNNLFKCKIDYYYAITYYYSGNTEKAKTYFEKIKDINDSLYYSKKAREYLENINKDKFLDMNFEDIPKYEKAALGAEADMEANSKQNKKAKLALLVIFVCVIIAALSLNTLLKTEYGTAEEVISSSMEFEADVKAMLQIENENASLCVFQNKEDLDYLYVAYLESYENGLYSFGIDYDFLAGADGVYSSFSDAYNQKQNGEAFSAEKFAQALHKDEPFKETFDDYKYFFKSGKKDITVVFKIVRDKEQILGGVHAESFSYTMENGNEKTYYIYVVDVKKENSAGYSTGIY